MRTVASPPWGVEELPTARISPLGGMDQEAVLCLRTRRTRRRGQAASGASLPAGRDRGVRALRDSARQSSALRERLTKSRSSGLTRGVGKAASSRHESGLSSSTPAVRSSASAGAAVEGDVRPCRAHRLLLRACLHGLGHEAWIPWSGAGGGRPRWVHRNLQEEGLQASQRCRHWRNCFRHCRLRRHQEREREFPQYCDDSGLCRRGAAEGRRESRP